MRIGRSIEPGWHVTGRKDNGSDAKRPVSLIAAGAASADIDRAVVAGINSDG